MPELAGPVQVGYVAGGRQPPSCQNSAGLLYVGLLAPVGRLGGFLVTDPGSGGTSARLMV